MAEIPHSCGIVCVYKQGMVESYYASPCKLSAIHYFCAPAPGCGSGWSSLIAPIRWSGIIRNSVVCLIGQIKNVTTRCYHFSSGLHARALRLSTLSYFCLPRRGGSETMSSTVANDPGWRKTWVNEKWSVLIWILNVISFLSTNRLL